MTHSFTMRTWQEDRLSLSFSYSPPLLPLLFLHARIAMLKSHATVVQSKTSRQLDICKCKVRSREAVPKARFPFRPSRGRYAQPPPTSFLSLCVPAGCDCTCLIPQLSLQLSPSSPPHDSASLFPWLYFPYLPPKSASFPPFLPLSLFFSLPPTP